MQNNFTLMNQFYLLITGIFICSLLACESEYTSMVKAEMASGEIHEDLLFGMKVGQTKKEFFDTCWKLNKEKKISQGTGNQYAKFYTTLDSTASIPQNVEILFYGIFDSLEVMQGMDMKVSYVAWAPWNKKYHSPVLVENLQDYYLEMYGGNPFIEIDINEEVKAYAKVDGNRQLLIYPMDNKEVRVKWEDLRTRKGFAQYQ